MPKFAHYTLLWSPLHQAYELHESPSGGIRDIISESPAWLARVSQISSFAFHGRNGSYSAWKELKQRGEGYWYASARIGGKMVKRYLGRGIDLALPRLEQVAQELQLQTSDTLLQKGGRPADQKTKAAPSRLPSEPLLATKLHVPRPRPQLVHRSRLIKRLQQGMGGAMILLSAPVGFGKSTLLSDWLSSVNIPAAWLSLDSQDNEATRFLSYLFAALRTYNSHLVVTEQVLGEQLQPGHADAADQRADAEDRRAGTLRSGPG